MYLFIENVQNNELKVFKDNSKATKPRVFKVHSKDIK